MGYYVIYHVPYIPFIIVPPVLAYSGVLFVFSGMLSIMLPCVNTLQAMHGVGPPVCVYLTCSLVCVYLSHVWNVIWDTIIIMHTTFIESPFITLYTASINYWWLLVFCQTSSSALCGVHDDNIMFRLSPTLIPPLMQDNRRLFVLLSVCLVFFMMQRSNSRQMCRSAKRPTNSYRGSYYSGQPIRNGVY